MTVLKKIGFPLNIISINLYTIIYKSIDCSENRVDCWI